MDDDIIKLLQYYEIDKQLSPYSFQSLVMQLGDVCRDRARILTNMELQRSFDIDD